jgi:hypothetical protein
MSPKLKFQQKVSIVEKLASPTTSVVKMTKIQSFSNDAMEQAVWAAKAIHNFHDLLQTKEVAKRTRHITKD